ncbi:MAG: GNAT family N-acetyltransferase [Vicinamibacterales bacterium]
MTTDSLPAVERGELLVAESDGTLLAVMLLRLQTTTLEVSSVAVRRAQQRRGIGAALLAFAEERARIQKVRQLRLYTNAALDALVEYYRRCGFVARERRMDRGFDRVFMTKDVVSSANTPRG